MTAPLLEWNAGFELGVEDIDLQHHYFANLINRLARDFDAAPDRDLRASLLNELSAYARFHFVSEENLMARAGYPRLHEHRTHHNRLIDELSHRQGLLMLRKGEPDPAPVLAFLVQWFLGHTMHEDRQFADFLRAQQGG